MSSGANSFARSLRVALRREPLAVVDLVLLAIFS